MLRFGLLDYSALGCSNTVLWKHDPWELGTRIVKVSETQRHNDARSKEERSERNRLRCNSSHLMQHPYGLSSTNKLIIISVLVISKINVSALVLTNCGLRSSMKMYQTISQALYHKCAMSARQSASLQKMAMKL